MGVEVLHNARNRRTRGATTAFAGLPDLRPAQQELLKRWLTRHTAGPKWQTLLEIAGRDQLDLADELRAVLLEAGVLQVKEQFVARQWLVERVVWTDLPALQAALGLRSAAERDAARDQVQQALRLLGETHAWALPAVHSCAQAGLPLTTLQGRRELLEALVLWQQEQRFGTRRDFALHARGGTKAIGTAEWDWLAAQLPLADFDIARFAPSLWLGGQLGLITAAGRVDVGALGFCALPMPALQHARVVAAPRRYWLIENRASFERQVAQAGEGDCVVWLPGQPPSDWLAAMGRLLDLAPAPGAISCDPDPAGVGIALQAGALWAARGLAWAPERMALVHWASAPASALNGFDRARLAQLEARVDLPDALRQLCADLRTTGRKAEQEGWV